MELLRTLAAVLVCVALARCDNSGTRKAHACEGLYGWLSCPAGQYIDIKSVFYGRQSSAVCVKENKALIKNTACRLTGSKAQFALARAKYVCNGRHTCSMLAMNDYFLGDPCPLTFKYLNVEFTCKSANACTNKGTNCGKVNPLKCTAFDFNNCYAACTNCDKKCINIHWDDAQCDAWAFEGHCQKNYNWMLAYCRKSCRVCDANEVCHNKLGDAACKTKKRNSECISKPMEMVRNCKQECGFCHKECVDMYRTPAMCATWAKNRECIKNPIWMNAYCTRSCGHCPDNSSAETCSNKFGDRQCVREGNAGNCLKYMHGCKKSCVCHDDRVCRDYYPQFQCEDWKKLYECKKSPGWMNVNCARTCGACRPPNK